MAVTNPERTIVDAAREILRAEGRPLTASQVYDAIVQNGLYAFHSDNPRHVVANQLRRHAKGYDSQDASAVRYFLLVDNGKFALLPEDEQGQAQGRRRIGARKTDAKNGMSASTDFDQVTTVEGSSNLVSARRRWPQRRKRLLGAEGGVISTEQVAHMLRTTPDAVEKRRQEGTLLGLSDDGESYVYPAWQFDREQLVPGLGAVLQALQGIGPWMRAAFMLTGDAHFQGERPLDVLLRGEIEAVVAAAREYGEQGGG